MKLGKWLKKRMLEPSSAAALAALTAIIGGEHLGVAVSQLLAAVGGVLAAIGIITPEGGGGEE